MNKSILKQISVPKANKVPFTIGGDPELFLQTVNGAICSSIPVLKRDKYNPIILDEKRKVKFYADNSLAEMAFAPSTNREDFVETYRLALQKAQNHLGKDFRLCVKSAHFFNENELEAAHGIDPKEIGCNPEFDFYKEEVKDLGMFESTMRSGSSHIHVGHPMVESFENKSLALKVIEIFLGCASVIWDNDESSLERRKKYGKSGSFRPTSYGFETRFMSNYMLNSPVLVELAYDLTQYSLSHIFEGTSKKVIGLVDEKKIQNAINNCDKKLAIEVLTVANLPKDLFTRVKKESKKKYNTDDFYKNCGIKI